MSGNYGASLRRARVQAGLSQAQLAEKVGVDRAHVARIETGSIRLPNESLREKIALALGGEPEPVGESPLTGSRARLSDTVRDLTEEQAEALLRVVDLLVRKNRANRGGVGDA